MLCGHISTFITSFTLDLYFVMKSYGTMRHSLGAWSPASHFSGGVLGCPFSCVFCLPLLLVRPGLGARELDQQVAPVLGVGNRRGPRHLWRSAFTLQISRDRPKGTNHEIKEMLYFHNFDKGPCGLRSWPWVGSLGTEELIGVKQLELCLTYIGTTERCAVVVI